MHPGRALLRPREGHVSSLEEGQVCFSVGAQGWEFGGGRMVEMEDLEMANLY